jgi:MFS family permease
MSMGVMSVSGETKLAFSDAGYVPKPGQEPSKRILKMEGKPGVSLKNLWVVPLCLFFSLFTGADTLQSMVYILQYPKFYD